MKSLFNILLLCVLSFTAFSQEVIADNQMPNAKLILSKENGKQRLVKLDKSLYVMTNQGALLGGKCTVKNSDSIQVGKVTVALSDIDWIKCRTNHVNAGGVVITSVGGLSALLAIGMFAALLSDDGGYGHFFGFAGFGVMTAVLVPVGIAMLVSKKKYVLNDRWSLRVEGV